MLFKKFCQKFSQNTVLATPSPSLFNWVCHDVTPSPMPKPFYPPPTAKRSYTYGLIQSIIVKKIKRSIFCETNFNQVFVGQIPERGKICDIDSFSVTLGQCESASEHFQNLVERLVRKLEPVFLSFFEVAKNGHFKNRAAPAKVQLADKQSLVFDKHSKLASF